MGIIVAILFAALGGLLAYNVRYRLIGWKYLEVAIGLVPILAIGYYYYGEIDKARTSPSFILSDYFIVFFVYVLGGIAPLLTVPAVTQWARHRR